MSKQDEKKLYEQQENRILAQSDAFISLLTKRGILGDQKLMMKRCVLPRRRKSGMLITIPRCFSRITGRWFGCSAVTRRRFCRNWRLRLRTLTEWWTGWIWRWPLGIKGWRAVWKLRQGRDCCWIGLTRQWRFSARSRHGVRSCIS